MPSPLFPFSSPPSSTRGGRVLADPFSRLRRAERPSPCTLVDSDGDGYVDGEEVFLHDTDPNDEESFPTGG